MKSIVLIAFLVAAANAQGYGQAAPAGHHVIGYQQASSNSYGGSMQLAPQASYGGQSSPSYGGQSSPSMSYSAPAAPVEAVRVSYSSGGSNDQSSYGSPAAQASSSYGGQSSAPASNYGGQSQSAPAYGGQSAPLETVRVSFGSGSSDQAAYGGQSSDASYGGQSSQAAPSYGGQSQSAPASYSAPAAPAAPVESVRVSFGSGASSDQSSYGGQSSQAAPSYGGQSSQAAPSYGGQSQSAPASYSAPAAPVESVRVSFGSGASSDQSSYGGQSSPAAYGGQSSQQSSQASYGGGYSAPSQVRHAGIVRHTQNINPGTSHQYEYETSDGTRASETTSTQQGTSSKVGQYSFTSTDGKVYSTNYQADASGYHAQGEHLPTPPPIPAEIAESLRANAYNTHVQAAPSNYGSHAQSSPSSYSRGY